MKQSRSRLRRLHQRARSSDQPSTIVTRARILWIALDLFTAQGYDRTSIRQIAERLGFSKAAIYYLHTGTQHLAKAMRASRQPRPPRQRPSRYEAS